MQILALQSLAVLFLFSSVLAAPSQHRNIQRSNPLSPGNRHSRRGDQSVTCSKKFSPYESYARFIHRFTSNSCLSGQDVDWWYNLCCQPLTQGQTLDSLAWCNAGPPQSTQTTLVIGDAALMQKPVETYVAPVPVKSPTPAPAPAPASYQFTGGKVTYFYQNGNPGACGKYHSDSDYVAALPPQYYANGSNCGKYIILSNDAGKTVKALVADLCPSCISQTSVDLSKAAFLQLATEEQGMVNVKWSFL